MIKKDAYRPCVAMLIIRDGRVLIFQRQNLGWQVPQGGIDKDESSEQAMWRELKEETNISPQCAQLIDQTEDYLYYTIPPKYHQKQKVSMIGQKQTWFLLNMTGDDNNISLNNMHKPEFIAWNWVSYWHPLTQIISFKREVYLQAFQELLPAALRSGI